MSKNYSSSIVDCPLSFSLYNKTIVEQVGSKGKKVEGIQERKWVGTLKKGQRGKIIKDRRVLSITIALSLIHI